LHGHGKSWAYTALVSVCLFWGTTYLAIRMALESFPALTLVAARFLLSGSLMVLGSLAARATFPRRRELSRTALNGFLILGIGNGCLALAEQWMPSGLAALVITVSPFWMIGLDAILPPRVRLHAPTVLGMTVGLLGTVLLVGPGAWQGGASGLILRGFLVLQAGCFSWSLGSLLQRKAQTAVHPIVSGGIQQLAAGVAIAVPALIAGGAIHWKTRGVAALLYLVVFGSIVGYSSYIYALQHLPVALLSIYNYVNPVVAVILGWLFYREPFGPREATAMVVIFVGVAIVKRMDQRRVQDET
jgi:drug/metabolite transporter (DMT)-like permease